MRLGREEEEEIESSTIGIQENGNKENISLKMNDNNRTVQKWKPNWKI